MIWRTDIENAPKEKGDKFHSRQEFLAIRNGKLIICWYNDDRYATKPRPYWDGSDGFMNTLYVRRNRWKSGRGPMPTDMIDTHALDQAVMTVMPDIVDAIRNDSCRTYSFAIKAYRPAVVAEYHRIRAIEIPF